MTTKHCPLCLRLVSPESMIEHLGLHSIRVQYNPACQACSSINGKVANEECQECMGTGFRAKEHKGASSVCPICLKLISDRNYAVHVGNHLKLGVPITPELIRANTRNPALGFILERKDGRPTDDAAVRIRCNQCDVVVAKGVMERHIREVHPKQAVKRRKNKRRKRPPSLPRISGLEPAVIPTQKREAICPRCAGTGGARGGCVKCEGTGWVPEEQEHPVVAGEPSGMTSTVTSFDYLGGNAGGHFRDRGAIGSLALHDDYGDESEA